MNTADDESKRRRERKIERTREDILEGAARAFAAGGVSGTTMRAIANEVGLTASSLYTYFGSKEEILAALFQRVHEESLSLLDEPMPSGLSFPQRLELLLIRQMRFAQQRRDIFVTMMSAITGESPHLGADFVAGQSAFVERLATWIGAHASEADLGGRRIEHVACFIWGTTNAFFEKWLREPEPAGSTELIELILDLILNGLS
jgi:AcrR family transcriptional regulator